MKILIEPSKKEINFENIDGVILSLKDFAVQSNIYFTLEEIKEIINNNPTKEIFININKNLQNKDIEPVTEILKELDNLKVKGIFFYDIAVVKIKKDLNLKLDLVWAQTHMVNNYKTCNYYYSKNVNYALLGKEITLEEIIEIINNTKLTPMVEVLGMPSVAFSKRKLITNFYKDINKTPKEEITVKERITNKDYLLQEDSNGTSFYLKDIVNGTSVIKDLYNAGLKYIIIKEYGLEEILDEITKDTKNYIDNNCSDDNYIEKYKKLGDNTNFFFKKTVYRVKKNG